MKPTQPLDRDQLHKRLIEVAAQSPAKKRKVGAIIARSNKSMSTGKEEFTVYAEGYNYNLSGGPCEDEDGNTVDTVIHAEVACINDLDISIKNEVGFKMYVTHPPCDGCKASLKSIDLEHEVMGDFLKFDSAKPRMSLVPASLNWAVAKVMTYGAKKYKVGNWLNTPDIEGYINALERHFLAFKDGEELDEESGLPHIDCVATNAAFIIELLKRNPNIPRIKESK